MFGAVKMTKNADVSKYKYFGYSIGFDEKRTFSHQSGSFGNNAIILGVDMSSSVHVDNKKKDILVLGEGPTQGLGCTAVTAEKMYSIKFTAARRKFCLNLRYNGGNSYLFVKSTEITKFKANDYEVVATPLCLGYVSKYCSVDNMKKLDYMDLSSILVFIIMLLQLLIYWKFPSI